MKQVYDLVVVGAGVLGTFHAYHALKSGYRVALLDKGNPPNGATIRNFGQVVPSGMDAKWQAYGQRSLEIYQEIHAKADISIRKNGTVYLASDAEELQLIEELASINSRNGYSSIMLGKQECLDKYTGLRTDYVQGGLFFPQEVTVEPREMIFKLHAYMQEQLGLELRYNCPVIECDTTGDLVAINTVGTGRLKAEKVVVCNGSDFKFLYPELFAQSDLEVCKLQMLQTVPQSNYVLPGSILTGWTIRRYESFRECPSYAAIKAKEASESFQKKWGVHILFKQAVDGSVIIGDSHEYADAADAETLGFDLHQEVDDFMVQEARKIVDLPNYKIQNRWFGMYSQCREQDVFTHTEADRIHIVTGIGGKGMTGSAGFAEEHIRTIMNS